MIKTTSILREQLSDYSNPDSKISRMISKNELFPIIRGLYETNRSVSPYLLAGSIYGPSYISFEYALSHYGLTPEAVYTVTCACFEKKKKKRYDTLFGSFIYQDVPSEVFPLGLEIHQEGDYSYRIATPEKALCDQLYLLPPAKNQKELYFLLTESLRIEVSALRNLNRTDILEYGEKYHSSNIKKLGLLLRRI